MGTELFARQSQVWETKETVDEDPGIFSWIFAEAGSRERYVLGRRSKYLLK